MTGTVRPRGDATGFLGSAHHLAALNKRITTMSKSKAIAKIDRIAMPHASAAYDRVLGEMRRLPTSKLVTMNLHVPTIVATALGALPRIRALRPRVVNDLPNLDLTRFDKLETYARALVYAHAIHQTA